MTDTNKHLSGSGEVPPVVRKAFDESYDAIRSARGGKRTRTIKPVMMTAAAVLLAGTVVVTNDVAMAKIQGFFGFQDSGLVTAGEKGDFHYSGVVERDGEIALTLEHTLTDENRMMFQLGMETADNVTGVDLEYRIYAADGAELYAAVSDTKTIDSEGFGGGQEILFNRDTGTIEVSVKTLDGAMPSLQDAVLVVETVHLTTESEMTSVAGEWRFDLDATDAIRQPFKPVSPVDGIELHEAVASNSAMRIKWTVNDEITDENEWLETVLIAPDGEEFRVTEAQLDHGDGTSTISMVFPYSGWSGEKSVQLRTVRGVMELELAE